MVPVGPGATGMWSGRLFMGLLLLGCVRRPVEGGTDGVKGKACRQAQQRASGGGPFGGVVGLWRGSTQTWTRKHNGCDQRWCQGHFVAGRGEAMRWAHMPLCTVLLYEWKADSDGGRQRGHHPPRAQKRHQSSSPPSLKTRVHTHRRVHAHESKHQPHTHVHRRGRDAHEHVQHGPMGALSRFVDAERHHVSDFLWREKLVLDHLEECVGCAWGRCKGVCRVWLRGVAGMAMLGAGSHFGRCVIVAHTVRVTGWPIFERAIKEIGQSYRNTREAVKKEVAHLQSPADLLNAVRYEIESLKRLVREAQDDLADGVLSPNEARDTIRQANVNMKRLNHEAWVLNQAVDSMAAITAAFDFHKLHDVAKSVYTGALGCVASANSLTVGKLSMTFDLAGIISKNVNYAFASLLDHYHSQELSRLLPLETRRLISACVGGLAAVKSVLIINALLPKMSLRISSAALGASWVADSVAAVVDPHLTRFGLSPITGTVAYVPLHVGLTLAGAYIQMRYDHRRFPVIVEALLAPLGIAEGQLRRFDKLFKK